MKLNTTEVSLLWLAENPHYSKVARISSILADAVAYNALLSLMDRPKMVVQICTENNTPLRSTYKAVKKLQAAGLVHVHEYVNSGASKTALYQSDVESISIKIVKQQGAKVEVRLGNRKGGRDKNE